MTLDFGTPEDAKKVLEKLTNELIHLKEKLGTQKHSKENVERVVAGRKAVADRINQAKTTLFRLIYDAYNTATVQHIEDYVALIETLCEALEAKETKPGQKEAKS